MRALLIAGLLALLAWLGLREIARILEDVLADQF